ncbi:MAG: sulfatase-like hydrolase/transferase [Chitinivibrionales bacterium]|nr:sulfatase-like hydrolase/transferase [Chitinivibrionales bacterium]
MNIILLVVDTLRYDRIGYHGSYAPIRTPNLDRLARKSLVYDNAFSSSFPTIPHRTDLITGRYGNPFYPWAPLRFDQPTLPRYLAEHGYCTQLIHDTPHLVNGGHAFDYPFHAWTFVRGAEVDRPLIDDQPLTMLDNWHHDPSLPLPEAAAEQLNHRMLITYTRANRGRREPEDWNAARLFTAATEFLRANRRRDNFFLWLDCFDPHEPWDAPPDLVRQYDKSSGADGRIDPRLFTEAARRDGDSSLPEVIVQKQTALYDAKVSWVDHWFGVLLDTLEETGLDDKTAIVLTADHGTNVYDWGKFGKTGPQSEMEAHVPLLVHVPGVSAERRTPLVQPQDITATLIDIANAPPPAWCDGTSVLAADSAGRDLALCGSAIDGWPKTADWPAFTAFAKDRYLMVSPDPAADRLYAFGSHDNCIEQHRDYAARLRNEALDEIAKRGAPGEVVAWYRNNGRTPRPEQMGMPLRPHGWRQYFTQTWGTWE